MSDVEAGFTRACGIDRNPTIALSAASELDSIVDAANQKRSHRLEPDLRSLRESDQEDLVRLRGAGLVPRRMAWLGLVGGPLLLIGNFGVLFDWWEPTGAVNVLVIPEFLWELLLGIYAAVWGFKAAPILAGDRNA